MLVDQVPGVPALGHALSMRSSLSESGKSFVEEQIHVKFNGGLKPFLLHIGATIASEGNRTVFSSDFLNFAHKA
jgi:hypothetical protein